MLAISINGETCSSCSGHSSPNYRNQQSLCWHFHTPPPPQKKKKKKRGEKVTLKGAGNSNYIEANYCKDTRISIGEMEENPVKWTVLIVNISYPVILVLDFLKAQNATIDLNEIQITLGGKKLNATFIDAGGKHVQIARVKLNQKVRLEPLSSVQVLGHLDQHIDGILCFSVRVTMLKDYFYHTPS